MSEASWLPEGLVLGEVELVVRDAPRVSKFYCDLLECAPTSREGTQLVYHPDQPAVPLLVLREDPQARDPAPRAPGLYHTAFRVSSRRELARALGRMANLGIQLDGAADHLVSEALYLHDHELNGIEIYADRPREKWPREGLSIKMDTLPLDLHAIMGELRRPGEGTSRVEVGHVHLRVSDLAQAEAFYCGVLGFEVKLRWRGALFVAAGDYHHHLGLNVWHSYGGGSLEPGTRGLKAFSIYLEPKAWELAVRRLSDAAEVRRDVGSAVLTDPFGIQVRLKPMREA